MDGSSFDLVENRGIAADRSLFGNDNEEEDEVEVETVAVRQNFPESWIFNGDLNLG